MASTPRDRAEQLLTRTEDFAVLGLGDLAALARTVARDSIDTLTQLDQVIAAAQALQERYEGYVAYHQAHCFLPDGRSRSGTPAEPYTG